MGIVNVLLCCSFLLATTLNGWTLACILWFRPGRDLSGKLSCLHTIIALLLGSQFMWSFGQSLDYISEVARNRLLFPPAAFAFINNASIVSIFGLNVCLAAERWLAVSGAPRTVKTRLYAAIAAFFILLSAWLAPCLLIAPSENRLTPSLLTSLNAYIVWTTAIVVGYCVSAGTITFCYWACFRRATTLIQAQTLSEASENGVTDAARDHHLVKLERILLRNCAVLTAAIYVCYLPIVGTFIGWAMGIIPFSISKYPTTLFNLINFLVVLDPIWTPCLILWFREDIRNASLLRLR